MKYDGANWNYAANHVMSYKSYSQKTDREQIKLSHKEV